MALSNISRQITETSNQKIENNIFITTFKQFGNITEITRDVVITLIDEIVVYEDILRYT